MSLKTAGLKPAPSKVAKTLDEFLNGVVKKGEANTETGSQDGASSHPTADADDSTQTAPEGEQTKDNTKQVKDMVGPASVDNAKENKAGSLKVSSLIKKADVGDAGTAADDQLQIGTKKTPTGEDSANETGMTTAGYPDPGTSHPAAVDNSELDGAKYANMSFAQLMPEFEKQANEYFTAISGLEVTPSSAAPAKTAANTPTDTSTATKAGAAAADAVIDSDPELNQELYQLSHSKVAEAYFTGLSDGDLVANHYDLLRKQAAERQAAATKKVARTSKRAEGMPGAMMDPAAAGGAPGGDPMAAMGGDPAGGDPMAAAGGEGGGSVLDSIDPETLLQILEELGVDPAALQGGAEPGGAAPGGDLGGGEPPAPPGGDEKQASVLQQTKKALAEMLTRSKMAKAKAARLQPRR